MAAKSGLFGPPGGEPFSPHRNVSRCLPYLHNNNDGQHIINNDGQTPAARGLEELFSVVLERFLVPIHPLHVYCKNEVGNTRKQIGNFVQIFLLNPNFLLVNRNRYSEGMDNGQKTPHGHPGFNSYVKILGVFIWNRQMDGQTDIYI